MPEIPPTIRIDESITDVDVLRADVDRWLADAPDGQPGGRSAVQLGAVAAVLRPALASVREHLLAHPDGGGAGETYEVCRQADRRTARLHRLWRWYADRFDQRRDPAHRAVLGAADEIVWSCWREVFDRTGRADARPPAPLTHVEPIEVPLANPRGEVPRELRGPADGLLARWTRALPVATVALPPTVARRPWWLVLAVHECGHHVLDELLTDDERPSLLTAPLEEAVARAGADPDEQGSWVGWGTELFADAVATVLAGTAPGWSVRELERRPSHLLPVPTETYPPPPVRWAVADRVGREVGLAPALPPDGGAGAGSPYLDRLMRRVPAAAAALVDAPVGGTTLRALGAGTPGWQGQANRWATALLAPAPPYPRRSVEAARLCAAGGMTAWRTAAARSRDGVVPERRTLAERLPEVIGRCGVEERRSATAAAAHVTRATALVLDDLWNQPW